MNDDRQLNTILENRNVPAPASNLAARIIDAAKANETKPFWPAVMDEILSMVVIPRPAYAMALILFLGLIFGLEIDLTSAEASQELFLFADITEEGSWL